MNAFLATLNSAWRGAEVWQQLLMVVIVMGALAPLSRLARSALMIAGVAVLAILLAQA